MGCVSSKADAVWEDVEVGNKHGASAGHGKVDMEEERGGPKGSNCASSAAHIALCHDSNQGLCDSEVKGSERQAPRDGSNLVGAAQSYGQPVNSWAHFLPGDSSSPIHVTPYSSSGPTQDQSCRSQLTSTSSPRIGRVGTARAELVHRKEVGVADGSDNEFISPDNFFSGMRKSSKSCEVGFVPLKIEAAAGHHPSHPSARAKVASAATAVSLLGGEAHPTYRGSLDISKNAARGRVDRATTVGFLLGGNTQPTYRGSLDISKNTARGRIARATTAGSSLGGSTQPTYRGSMDIPRTTTRGKVARAAAAGSSLADHTHPTHRGLVDILRTTSTARLAKAITGGSSLADHTHPTYRGSLDISRTAGPSAMRVCAQARGNTSNVLLAERSYRSSNSGAFFHDNQDDKVAYMLEEKQYRNRKSPPMSWANFRTSLTGSTSTSLRVQTSTSRAGSEGISSLASALHKQSAPEYTCDGDTTADRHLQVPDSSGDVQYRVAISSTQVSRESHTSSDIPRLAGLSFPSHQVKGSEDQAGAGEAEVQVRMASSTGPRVRFRETSGGEGSRVQATSGLKDQAQRNSTRGLGVRMKITSPVGGENKGNVAAVGFRDQPRRSLALVSSVSSKSLNVSKNNYQPAWKEVIAKVVVAQEFVAQYKQQYDVAVPPSGGCSVPPCNIPQLRSEHSSGSSGGAADECGSPSQRMLLALTECKSRAPEAEGSEASPKESSFRSLSSQHPLSPHPMGSRSLHSPGSQGSGKKVFSVQQIAELAASAANQPSRKSQNFMNLVATASQSVNRDERKLRKGQSQKAMTPFSNDPPMVVGSALPKQGRHSMQV